MRARISQREAHRLKKRVVALEDAFAGQRRRWSSEWLGGIEIAALTGISDGPLRAIATASALSHAVVARVEDGKLRFVALPHPKDEI